MKVAASSNTDIAIICAGEEGNFTLEDAACAGRYVRAIPKRAESIVLNDAASASVLIERKYGDNIAKVFKESSHGQELEAAGFGDDLTAAAEVDSYSVVPIYQDRQIPTSRAGNGHDEPRKGRLSPARDSRRSSLLLCPIFLAGTLVAEGYANIRRWRQRRRERHFGWVKERCCSLPCDRTVLRLARRHALLPLSLPPRTFCDSSGLGERQGQIVHGLPPRHGGLSCL